MAKANSTEHTERNCEPCRKARETKQWTVSLISLPKYRYKDTPLTNAAWAEYDAAVSVEYEHNDRMSTPDE